MKKIRFVLALAGMFVMSTTVHAQYADAVLSYNPGTGFAAGYTYASSGLGAPTSGSSVTPFAPPYTTSQLVSIGAGGEITLQLSTPIVNNPSDPYGINFILFANEFFVEGSGGVVSGLYNHTASSSITVLVSPDDSTWYTLNPTLAPQAGSLFPTDGSGNPQIAVNPALTLADFTGQNLAGIRSLYAGSAGGTGYDLAWAQDAEGDSVDLASADYVQIDVQSGVLDLDAVSVVPEPSTWALLLAGATGLLCFRLKKPKFQPIKIKRLPLILVFALPAMGSASAVTFTENFTNDPAQNGWQVFGDTNLFQWDSTNDVMDVTWDSSQTNSYFYHPLGTTLIQADSFSLSFDIQLNSIEYSGYPALAVGLFNYCDATNSAFSRPYATTPNLFEFDYYPDDGDTPPGPNVAATMTDETGGLTNDPDFYFIFDYLPMNDGVTYHVTLTHAAGEEGLTATMCMGGQIYTTMPYVYGSEPMADFRLDTVSISSYQDEYDPLFAQGTVGNFVVTLPPPGRNLEYAFSNDVAQVRFGTYTNWNYMLERSTNLAAWSAISPCVPGNGRVLKLCDTNAPATQAFYRVKASQSE